MSVAASLDTNVLVRLVVKDDAQQLAAAQRMFAHYAKQAQTLFVPITVMLELEWVLRSRYKFGKPDILNLFSSLLMTLELEFEAEDALEQALVSHEEGTADFADCLHLALARNGGALPFLTFDADASKLNGAKLLE